MPWIAVAALAAVAWGVTVMLARTMGNGPGTMGLALLPFLGLWLVMMAAMMLPSVAPVAVLWTRLIAGALSMSSDQLVGMDGQEPAVITNAPFGAVPQPVRQARAKDVSYHGHWSADFSGTNSFVTDFRYEG